LIAADLLASACSGDDRDGSRLAWDDSAWHLRLHRSEQEICRKLDEA
jgi:hypothetical protein